MKTFATALIFMAVVRPLVVLSQQTRKPGDLDPPVAVEGTYVNKDYGYSVRIPDQLRAYRPSAPAPQHGVVLRKEDSEEISVNAEYDALMLGSAEALTKNLVDMLSATNQLRIVRSSRSHLSGLEARDVVLQREDGKGKITYVHLILALRALPNEVGIVYTIIFQARRKDSAAENTFASIANSFRIIDRRP